MTDTNDCQSRYIDELSGEVIGFDIKHPDRMIKYILSKLWNRTVKPILSKFIKFMKHVFKKRRTQTSAITQVNSSQDDLQPGDWVRVKSKEEIEKMLNFGKKYQGCTFLDCMQSYCGTEQKVFKRVNYFLDERDFRYKKTVKLVLLENVYCDGKLVFGNCDRSCFLFWREEWLEKIQARSVLICSMILSLLQSDMFQLLD